MNINITLVLTKAVIKYFGLVGKVCDPSHKQI